MQSTDKRPTEALLIGPIHVKSSDGNHWEKKEARGTTDTVGTIGQVTIILKLSAE